MSVSLLSLSFSLTLQSPISKQSTCQDHGRTPTLVSSTTCKPWNASDPADCPPYLNEGASFSNNESLFFYGGYASEWGGPPVPPLATWKYDIAYKNWTRDGFWGVPLVRLTQGGSVQSSVDKNAYYLSGTLHPAGNPVFHNTPGADTSMTPGADYARYEYTRVDQYVNCRYGHFRYHWLWLRESDRICG